MVNMEYKAATDWVEITSAPNSKIFILTVGRKQVKMMEVSCTVNFLGVFNFSFNGFATGYC